MTKKHRFIKEYLLSEHDADVLINSRTIADLFEQTYKYHQDAKSISKFILGEVFRYLRDRKTVLEKTKLTPENFSELLELIDQGTINLNLAKSIFPEIIESGLSPKEVVQKRGLVQVSDETELNKIVLDVMQTYPVEVEKYLAGKETLVSFFVGKVMMITQKKGNPKIINQLVLSELQKLKQ